MLDKILTILYEANALSLDAILQWESATDGRKGRAVALLSAKGFLQWVKTTDQDESDDEVAGQS